MAERITKERLKMLSNESVLRPYNTNAELRRMARELLAYRDSGALARSIADALFTNGRGEKAERLVLELADKRGGGGWCRKAVEDVIQERLEAIGE